MKNLDPALASDKVVQLQNPRRTALVPTVARPQAPTIVPFAQWVAVRDQAAAGLLGGGRRLMVTGPPGTGKTVLLEHLARVLRAAGRPVLVQLADADPLPPQAGAALFVDEADRLGAAKRLELLTAPGTVVLAGLASLAPRRLPAGTTHLTLEPLDQDEARAFVAQWLQLNGRTPAQLESPAVRRLVELSGGVPRLMSTLLASATWLAETTGAPVILAAHVQEAAELRSVLGAAPPPPAATEPVRRGRPAWSALLAATVLVGTAAAVAPRLFPNETGRGLVMAEDLFHRAERWARGEPDPERVAARADPAPTPAPPPPAVDATPAAPRPTEAEPVDAVPVESTPVPDAPVEPRPAPVVIVEQPAADARPVEEAAREPEPPPPAATELRTATEPEPPVAAAPEPLPAEPTPPTPAPVPASARQQERRLDLPIETVAFLLRRGTEMMQLNDLSAARLLFRRAAESGNSEAMFELARTFDPAVLTPLGSAGMADAAEASRWYRRAAEGGNREAEAALGGK